MKNCWALGELTKMEGKTTFQSKESRISILLVDDDPNYLQTLREFVEKVGNFDIDICNSSESALHLLFRKRFDIIITDYDMPGINGVEFIQQVRFKNEPVFIILLSGGSEKGIEMSSGADRFLQKGNAEDLEDLSKILGNELVESRAD